MVITGRLPQALPVLIRVAPCLFLAALILVTAQLPTVTGQSNACRSNGPQLRPLIDMVLSDSFLGFGKVILDEPRGYMFFSSTTYVSQSLQGMHGYVYIFAFVLNQTPAVVTVLTETCW